MSKDEPLDYPKYATVVVCPDCGHYVLYYSFNYFNKNCTHCGATTKNPIKRELDKNDPYYSDYDNYTYYD
jgi:uncharacterized protein (DUF983 family)